MNNVNKFLAILFEQNESICAANSTYETRLNCFSDSDIFFSINPMHTSRADSNVTCYRNILLECDNMPLIEQIEYVTSKVPVTTIVYSGGKSYHFIISLAEPYSNREEYDTLVKRLHKLLPKVDPTTKNPSRFSRLPGATRPDTNKEQKLIYLGSQIPRATLEERLPALEIATKPPIKPADGFFSTLVVDAMFHPDTVMQKVGIQSRNGFFFWLGQRLKEGNATPEQKLQIIEQAYANLRNKTDFKLTEAKLASRVTK